MNMCELCEAEGTGDNLSALLNALFGPVVDYFDEYRTESEADLTGELPEGGTWKVSVAKVGGGTVGKTYPAGEEWILQAYQNGELLDSRKAAAPDPMTHEQALRDAAGYYFDYQD